MSADELGNIADWLISHIYDYIWTVNLAIIRYVLWFSSWWLLCLHLFDWIDIISIVCTAMHVSIFLKAILCFPSYLKAFTQFSLLSWSCTQFGVQARWYQILSQSYPHFSSECTQVWRTEMRWVDVCLERSVWRPHVDGRSEIFCICWINFTQPCWSSL